MNRLVLLATAWGPQFGGINSFNYDLARSLAVLLAGRVRNEIRDDIAASAVETRRHFDVVAEQLMNKIHLVGEGVIGIDQKVDRRPAPSPPRGTRHSRPRLTAAERPATWPRLTRSRKRRDQRKRRTWLDSGRPAPGAVKHAILRNPDRRRHRAIIAHPTVGPSSSPTTLESSAPGPTTSPLTHSVR